MFLKNSFTFFFLTLWLVPFAFGNSSIHKKQDILSIPKLNIEEKVKAGENQIELNTDLELLNFQDEITIEKEDGTYYYKVMQKSNSFSWEYDLIKREDILVLEGTQKEETLQTVIIAIQTGKLVKN